MYRYPCPNCRSTNVLHRRDCRFEERDRGEIEHTYISILSVLAAGPITRDELRSRVPGPWSALSEAVLKSLEQDARINVEGRGDEAIVELVPPDEIADRLEPVEDPLRTIYEHGSVPGAHDNSVFAMVAYYSSKGLTWEDTRRQVLNWLRESGTWERGGFEEPSPEALVDAKRHVHEEGYGWLEKATAAKRVVEDSHLVGNTAE